MEEKTYWYINDILIDLADDAKCRGTRRQHYHNTYEIVIMLDGEKYLVINNKRYLLKRGDLFIIKPYSLHTTYSTDEPYVKRYLIHFDAENIGDEIFDSQLPSCVISLDEEQLHNVYYQFVNIHNYLKRNNPNGYKLARMAVVLMMDYIYNVSKKNTVIPLYEDYGNYPISKALAYINTNYQENLTLDMVSGFVHMSKSNFCLVFKRVVGETFANYLNSLRIAHVHKLLSTTDMSLSEIAERTGFSTVDYMSKSFKKIHGLSPAKMRKQKDRLF